MAFSARFFLICDAFAAHYADFLDADGSVSTDSAKDEEEAQEFKQFVQSIKPSDFEKMLKDNEHFENDQ